MNDVIDPLYNDLNEFISNKQNQIIPPLLMEIVILDKSNFNFIDLELSGISIHNKNAIAKKILKSDSSLTKSINTIFENDMTTDLFTHSRLFSDYTIKNKLDMDEFYPTNRFDDIPYDQEQDIRQVFIDDILNNLKLLSDNPSIMYNHVLNAVIKQNKSKNRTTVEFHDLLDKRIEYLIPYDDNDEASLKTIKNVLDYLSYSLFLDYIKSNDFIASFKERFRCKDIEFICSRSLSSNIFGRNANVSKVNANRPDKSLLSKDKDFYHINNEKIKTFIDNKYYNNEFFNDINI